jgi:hypothetical protein
MAVSSVGNSQRKGRGDFSGTIAGRYNGTHLDLAKGNVRGTVDMYLTPTPPGDSDYF